MKLTATEQTYKPFGEMTRDEQIEIVTAFYVDNADVEWHGKGGAWTGGYYGAVRDDYYYRLADQPKPKQGATIEFTHDELVKLDESMTYRRDSGMYDLYNTIADHLEGETQ